MDVVGYVRVSTEEQRHGSAAQRDALERWCAANGAELVDVFEDHGVSGAAPLDQRPALLDALGALTDGAVLLVARRDRLARDVMAAAMLERLAERAGARIVAADGATRNARVLELYEFHGLEKKKVATAAAGDIVVFSGSDDLAISDTLCPRDHPEGLPALAIDEPTISMTFQVNKSPFAGDDGKFLTSRQIGERLEQELKHNVALRVEQLEDPDKFRVSGRGELHLSVLIENMRREGFELAVSRPEVILHEEDGQTLEPWEQLTVDFDDDYQGAVMTRLADRKGELVSMQPDGKGRVRLDYKIPTRGLIGFRTEYLTATSGTGLIYHVFDQYGPYVPGTIGQRNNGALISKVHGKALAYSLYNLQERGKLMINHADPVYEGMIVGINSRQEDLVVNPTKAKQLTNIRAAGSDENLLLTPPIRLSLEQALEFIDDDELVEVTPLAIRLRKKLLTESERKRDSRQRASQT